MNFNRLNGIFALTLVGGLALSACGDSDDNKDTGGGSNPDSGTPIDMGDAGMADTGADGGETMPDTGMPDTGAPDTGVTPDMGVPTTAGEGESCATLECGADLVCVGFGGEFAVCLNVCQSDADCTGSVLDPASTTCANEGRLTTQDGQEFGWCVQQLVGEGETYLEPPNPSVSVVGPRLKACEEGTTNVSIDDETAVCMLECEAAADCSGSIIGSICGGGLCVSETVGEGETALVDGTNFQGCDPELIRLASETPGGVDCARNCATDADCTTPGLGFCSPNNGSFTSETITGLCMASTGYHGQPCSDSHFTRGCTIDRDTYGTVFCTDFFGTIDDNEEYEAYCLSFCGDLDQDPATPDDGCVRPANRPNDPDQTCTTSLDDGSDLLAVAGVGVCNDNCEAFPNSCGGTDPVKCAPSPIAGLTFSQCTNPLSPELEIWYPDLGAVNATFDCSANPLRCPADTICVSAGNAAACVLGCAPGEAVTGCEGKSIGSETNLTCTDISNGQGRGICEPAAS